MAGSRARRRGERRSRRRKGPWSVLAGPNFTKGRFSIFPCHPGRSVDEGMPMEGEGRGGE